jgi:hypothetical protein
MLKEHRGMPTPISRLGLSLLAPVLVMAAAGCSSGGDAVTAAATAAAGTVTAPSGSAAAPTAASPLAPSATPAPSASATPAPTPVASPEALCSVNQASCALAAGRYTTAPSKSSFDVTVGEGWTNERLDPGGGEIVSPAGTSVFWVVDPGFLRSRSGKYVQLGKTTGAVADYLTSLPNASASSPADATVGGVPATQVDVVPSKRNDFVLVSGHVGFGAKEGTKSRYFIVPRNGHIAVIIVSTDGSTTLDEATAEVQPVLDSISWE